MEKNETQLARSIPANGTGLVLSSIEDMYRFAKCVAQSGLAPSSFKTAEQVVIALQTGAELRMPPMRSLQSFCVVNGQARLWGDAPLALVRQSGLLQYIKERIEGEGDNMVAHCETHRKGDPEPKVTTFSVQDAKVARLWGKNVWASYPKRMLQMRARSLNLRDNFPDCFGGATIAEEYEGIAPPDEAPMPQVPARDERKQAEGVNITDSKQVVEVALEGLLNLFSEYLVTGLYGPDTGETRIDLPGNVLLSPLAKLASLVFGDGADYRNAQAYTIEKITQLKTHLEREEIAAEVLDIVRDALEPPPAEGADPPGMDKLNSYKYACQNEKCQAVFDEAKKAGNGRLQCPVCLKCNVKEAEPVGVSDEA